jgi:hypothetical protein
VGFIVRSEPGVSPNVTLDGNHVDGRLRWNHRLYDVKDHHGSCHFEKEIGHEFGGGQWSGNDAVPLWKITAL